MGRQLLLHIIEAVFHLEIIIFRFFLCLQKHFPVPFKLITAIAAHTACLALRFCEKAFRHLISAAPFFPETSVRTIAAPF